VYGAKLFNLPEVLHGVTSKVSIRNTHGFFDQVPDQFAAAHYHSWAVEPSSIGENLRVTATNHQGIVMAIEHVSHQVCGVQFHPESVLTGHGKQMISNWIKTERK
jgi:anthranilate synthase component 2